MAASFAAAGNLAVDRPLLAQPNGQRAQVLDHFGKLDRAIPAKRRDKAADFGLFLDQQPLELGQIVVDRASGARGAPDRLDPKRSAGKELDDAVVDVASERQAGLRGDAFLNRRNQCRAVKDRARRAAKLAAKIDIIDRQFGNVFKDQPAFRGARSEAWR